LSLLIERRSGPVVAALAAATRRAAQDAWKQLEAVYLTSTDTLPLSACDFAAPKQPARLPWVAVIVLDPDQAPEWAVDLCTAVTQAWLRWREEVRHDSSRDDPPVP